MNIADLSTACYCLQAESIRADIYDVAIWQLDLKPCSRQEKKVNQNISTLFRFVKIFDFFQSSCGVNVCLSVLEGNVAIDAVIFGVTFNK